MTTRGHNQLFPYGPGFDLGSSTILSMSNAAVPRNDAFPSQIRIENPAVGAAQQVGKQQPLSSPLGSKRLKSRQMMENLVAENSGLRAKLGTSQSQQADVVHKIDRMVTDLVKTKSEIRAKEVRLSSQQGIIEKQRKELEQLRHDVSKMSAEFPDLQLTQSDIQNSAKLQQAIDQLKTEMRQKDLDLSEKCQLLQERDFELLAMRNQLEQEQKQRRNDAIEMQGLQATISEQGHTQRTRDDSQPETKPSRAERLQQELQDLKTVHASALSKINTENAQLQQYFTNLSVSKSRQDAAYSAIDAERAKSFQYLQEIDQRNVAYKLLESQIEARDVNSQKLTQELNDLQASLGTVVAETRVKLEAQQQLEASHANNLAEAHRMAKFFKKNSEASSRKVKALKAEIQSLMKSLPRNREVWDDGTTNAALQGDNSFEAPGAWPHIDVRRNSSGIRGKPPCIPSILESIEDQESIGVLTRAWIRER